MKPILYKAGETDFNHNGIGALSETIACEVTEERNGEFELYLEYPASGLHYAEIQELCLVKAKPNSVDELHLFRIYERLITLYINNYITFNFLHSFNNSVSARFVIYRCHNCFSSERLYMLINSFIVSSDSQIIYQLTFFYLFRELSV